MNFIRLIILLSFIVTISVNATSSIPIVDFKHSMGYSDSKMRKILYMAQEGEEYFNLLKNRWIENNPSQKNNKLNTIPKVVHQIWVGPNHLPPLYKFYREECQRLNPDFEFKLWTNDDFDKWEFDTKELFLNARKYAEKSDIFRFQVLHDFGGIYLDLDNRCFKPFGELFDYYDFVGNLEYPISTVGRVHIQTSFIAAKPRHTLITNMLNFLNKNWVSLENAFDNLEYPQYLGGGFDAYIHALGIIRSLKPFTTVYVDYIKENPHNNSIVFPSTYSVPLEGGYKVHKKSTSRFFKDLIKGTKRNDPFFTKIRPESLVSHDYSKVGLFMPWENEMLPLNYKKEVNRKIKNLSNPELVKWIVYSGNYEIRNGLKVKFNNEFKIERNIQLVDLYNQFNKNIISDWQNKHLGWSVEKWDLARIEREIPEYNKLAANVTTEADKPLLARILIADKFGGLIVSDNVKPLKDFTELNNKYHFYAGMLPINSKHNKVRINEHIFASIPDHEITRRIKQDIYKALARGEELDISKIYNDNIYRYLDLWMPNIVLPAHHLNPIDENRDDLGLIQKIRYKLKGINSGYLSEYSEMSLVKPYN